MLTVKFSARDKQRINLLSPARRRFFCKLLARRFSIPGEYPDTPAGAIIQDCLICAEARGLNIKRELADLNTPIPNGTQGQSSAGWAMTQTHE